MTVQDFVLKKSRLPSNISKPCRCN